MSRALVHVLIMNYICTVGYLSLACFEVYSSNLCKKIIVQECLFLLSFVHCIECMKEGNPTSFKNSPSFPERLSSVSVQAGNHLY